MGSSKKQTVGYWYKLGLHFIVCRAPVDAFLEIVAGDRTAWKGNVTASTQITIDKPNLWGGEEREGGIVGKLDVMFGEPTQGPNDYLAAKQPGIPQPAYRGRFGLVFRGGKVSAMNPYIKPWAIRVRRILKGWDGDVPWYPEKASIDLGDGHMGMNPAHMIYQILTDPTDGMAYPRGLMGASFTKAADTLHAEGFGLCAAWKRQTSIEDFVQEICDHIGGVVARDPATGLWELELLRGDYDPATLPAIDPDWVTEVLSATRATLGETVNTITVVYRDAATGKDGSVTVHQLANIQAQGASIVQKMNYPMLAVRDLATRVAARDVRVKSAEMWRFKVRMNRKARRLRVGRVYRYTDLERGIVGMPVRVININMGSQRDTAMTVDLAEDVFGLPATTYIGSETPGPGGGPVPGTPPAGPTPPPAAFNAYEASYRDILREGYTAIEVDALTKDAGLVAGVAAKAAVGYTRNWTLYTSANGDPYEARQSGSFAGTALTAGAITRISSSVDLVEAIDMDSLAVGQVLQFGDLERCRVRTVSGSTIGIDRGVEDTVPRAWPAGTRVWVVGEGAASDLTEYLAGSVVSAKAVTNGAQGPIALADAPIDTVTVVGRHARPYPPARVFFGLAQDVDAVQGPFSISWEHRNRVLQADKLLGTLEPSVAKPADVRYGIRVLDANGTVLAHRTDVDGKSATIASDYAGTMTVELYAIDDGGESWQRHSFTFNHGAATGATGTTITATTWTPPQVIIDGGEVTG